MKFNDVIYHLNHTFMFKFQSNLLPSAFSNSLPRYLQSTSIKLGSPRDLHFAFLFIFFYVVLYLCLHEAMQPL